MANSGSDLLSITIVTLYGMAHICVSSHLVEDLFYYAEKSRARQYLLAVTLEPPFIIAKLIYRAAACALSETLKFIGRLIRNE